MIEQYLAIKNKYKDVLLFYRMGDFYELFFEDAIIASKALDITLTKRGKSNGTDIPMCGVPFHSADNYLPKLIKKGFHVAVCEQTETPNEAKANGKKGPLKREVVRIISPGTITEDNLLESKANNFLGAIIKLNNAISISWVDVSTGYFKSRNFENKNNEINQKNIDAFKKIAMKNLINRKIKNIEIEKYKIVRFNTDDLQKYLSNIAKSFNTDMTGLKNIFKNNSDTEYFFINSYYLNSKYLENFSHPFDTDQLKNIKMILHISKKRKKVKTYL